MNILHIEPREENVDNDSFRSSLSPRQHKDGSCVSFCTTTNQILRSVVRRELYVPSTIVERIRESSSPRVYRRAPARIREHQDQGKIYSHFNPTKTLLYSELVDRFDLGDVHEDGSSIIIRNPFR